MILENWRYSWPMKRNGSATTANSEGDSLALMPVEPPDTFYLQAAMGWLDLGDPREAGEEIARISHELLDHPDVLEVRWAICAATKSWETAAEVAETLVAVAPERSSGWIHRAYALRRCKKAGLQHAWAALRPAVEQFPKEDVIPYNLACYAAQFGWVDIAWDWLRKAAKACRDEKLIRDRALADSDLKTLWERLRRETLG